jgi:hypothetical protein
MGFECNRGKGGHVRQHGAWQVLFQTLCLLLWSWLAASGLRAAVMPSLVSTSGATALGTAALSWSHTIGSGQNRVLFVALHFEDEGSAGSSATAITWTVSGVPQSLTLIPATSSLRSGEIGLQLWGLVAPTVGTGTISVTKSSFSGDVFVGRAWNYVDARQVLDGTIVTAVGNESAPSLSIASKTNHLMMGLVSVAKYSWTNAPTQTLQYAGVVEDLLPALTINDAEGVWFGGATINGTGANVSFQWGTTEAALTGSGWVAIGYAVQSASYLLGGTVWRDNGSPGADDGTQGAGESGIANVTVELRAPHPLSGPAEPLLATTTTDASGNYRFTDLDPGTYLVLLRATNFSTGPVVGLYSSGTAADLHNASSLATDGLDDGLNAQYPARTGVQSEAVVLGSADSTALDFGLASPAPTAVGLAYFHAARAGGGWDFEWRTLWEESCLGFDLVVIGSEGERILNAELVPSVGDGLGHVYGVRLEEGVVVDVGQVFLRETELDGDVRYYGAARRLDGGRGSGLTAQAGGSWLTLVLETEPGREVELLWADRLDGGEWRTLGTRFADSAGRVVHEVTEDEGATSRFFRVRVL